MHIGRIQNKGLIYIEEGYGEVLGFADEDYLKEGIRVVTREEVLTKDIICDPKIGDAEYLSLLEDQILFGWIHAVQSREITDMIIDRKLTVFAWEDMYENGRHCFWRNNEIAGEAAVCHAYMCHGVFPYNTKAAILGKGNIARGALRTLNYMGADVTVYESIDPNVTSEFVGYEHLTWESDVTVLTTETEIADALSEGEHGTVFVQETPFYATSGGQEADTGYIRTAEGEFKVEDTVKLLGGKVGHVGVMTKGMIRSGDKVVLEVDAKKRALSARNHSATHLLQKALRTVLGSHVEQAGSSVNEDRLRFDFTHFSAMTEDEITQVEKLVNESIAKAYDVDIKNMPIEEAKKTGAQALFGEKYGDIVRVVNMGDYSIEFCGGTHVNNTSEIMALKIVSETGVAAGVRRIEALTSEGLMKYYAQTEEKLKNAAALLKATPDNLSDKIHHMIAENKTLHSEVESLKSKIAQSAAGDVLDQVKEVKGIKLLAAQIEGVDMNGLRELGDQLKEKLGDGVVVLASGSDGKVSLMATATDGAMKKGAHAGNLVKAIAGCVGGGGGGRPNMAQAGGKNPSGIQDALKKAEEVLAEQIKE